MTTFDVAIGIDASGVNQVSAAVYKQLYPGIFQGAEKVSFGGADLTLEYDVKSAPTFVLAPPAEGSALIAQHLADDGVADSEMWTLDELRRAIEVATTDNVFQILMDDFMFSIDDGSGEPATDKLQVTVIAQANSAGGKLTLIPLKAIAKAANPSDQTLVNKFIVPRVLSMAKTLLSGITLPPIHIPGISLTPPVLFVDNERLVAVANRVGSPVPTPPFPKEWPSQSFFAVLSQDLREEIAGEASSKFKWSGSKSGSVGSSIGGVSYSARASIRKPRVSAPAGDPTVFDAAVEVRGNVSAEVTFLCVPVGVNYNLYPNHSPITARVVTSIKGLEVLATVQKISSFTIILAPSGNVIQKVISAITRPITEAVAAAFSPAIVQAIEGATIPIMTVPSFPYEVDPVHLTITPRHLSLTNWNGYLGIVGNVTIS